MERLDKNFLWLSAGNTIASIFNIAIFIYLARILKAEAFGYLAYATTIVFYLLNFTDVGLSTYGMREIARSRSKLPELVNNILSFRFMLASALFFFFIIAVVLSRQQLLVKVLMAEAGFLLFVPSLSLEWAFQGLEKMHMVFASLVANTALQAALIFTCVKTPHDVVKVPVITVAAAIPVLVIFIYLLRFKPRFRRLEWTVIKSYLSSSLAIWAISVFAQVYNTLDIVMLGFFRSPEEVGYFTVARRVIGGTLVLIMVLVSAVMPHLSAAFVRDKRKFWHATVKFLKIGILAVIAVFLPIIIFAKEIILWTVGEQYIQAARPLSIMMFAVILIMFNVPFSTGLIAARFEKSVLKQAFASACVSIVSNFILMPKYGMIGASVSFVLAESLALIWILTLYRINIRKG